jgi:hypothetical protein
VVVTGVSLASPPSADSARTVDVAVDVVTVVGGWLAG